jgi:fumarylpyruvate hydrolase
LSNYVIPFWEPPALAVIGSDDLFPIHRVYCVGRNYVAHGLEMGGDPDREPPFFFAKPADALVVDGATIPFPPATSNLHHEVEMVVALSSGGTEIAESDALNHVFGYGVGIDLTRRDLQDEAKKMARPWDMSKGFDNSAPCSALRRASEIGHPESARIVLKANGEIRQDSDVKMMIWNVPEMIAYLSRLLELRPGDVIFSGTPEGVAACINGDRLEASVEGIADLTVTLA